MQKILSVGIDVGTSTTQIVFSELEMDDAGGFFSVPKISIVDKKVVYKSQVFLTPLKNDVLIDTEALKEIVAREFDQAGFKPSDTQSGAVIITGESARKDNADAVLAGLSGYSGDFVVSAAGPDMESLIAGKGSGAYAYSLAHHCKVANLDIGGGTTNVVVFDEGIPVARGCLDIGGRLVRVGRGGVLTKVSPAAALVAESVGVKLVPGDPVDVGALEKVTAKMAKLLAVYLGIPDVSGIADSSGENSYLRGFDPLKRSDTSGTAGSLTADLLSRIKTPGSGDFKVPEHIDAVFFSGGVADLIYHPQEDIRKYGDIGVLLGRAIADSGFGNYFELPEPGETIRATVVGAGTYTTNISGSTITYSEDIFPLKNIPVIKLDKRLQEALFEGEVQDTVAHVRWYLEQNHVDSYILAMAGKKDPDYTEMKRAAAAITRVMDATLAPKAPMILVIECDIAKAMGQMIRQIPGINRQVVAIDSIHVEDGEYVDMGKPMMNGMVIPVVVKTLIFG